VYAVTGCLEIISEASRRLPDDIKNRHTSIARKNIAGAGNVYRHDYEDVAATQVWETVRLALPSLRAVVNTELATPTLPKPPENDRYRTGHQLTCRRPTYTYLPMDIVLIGNGVGPDNRKTARSGSITAAGASSHEDSIPGMIIRRLL
jgi:hypothetical protein